MFLSCAKIVTADTTGNYHTRMSIEVMSLAWYVEGITPVQKAVLVALADHAGVDGRNARPSVDRLVVKTSCAERTVRRALADLRNLGLIHISTESAQHRATEYTLDLPEMQARSNERYTARPARNAPLKSPDLPESPPDLPENTARPARNAPDPSYNGHKPSMYIPPQEIPNEATPFPEQQDAIEEMKSTISQIVKEVLAAGISEDKFEAAAISLINRNITREQVRTFGEWWKANGYYKGKPAIKTLLDEIENSLMVHSPNGVAGAWQEIKERAVQPGKPEFSSEKIKKAIGPLWPQVKAMTSFTERDLKTQFERNYNAIN